MVNIFPGKQSCWCRWRPKLGIWGRLFWQEVWWSWFSSGGKTRPGQGKCLHSIPCCRLSWDKDHSGMVLQPEEGDRSEDDWRVRARAGRVWWGQTPPSETFATQASTRSRAVSKPSQTDSHPRQISAPTASLNSLTTPSHPLSTVTFIQTISASECSSIPCELCSVVHIINILISADWFIGMRSQDSWMPTGDWARTW